MLCECVCYNTTCTPSPHRDGVNNFNSMRPWTVAQMPNVSDASRVRPQWFTAWKELRCLQYVYRRPGDHEVVQRMEHGNKVRWGGRANGASACCGCCERVTTRA